MPEPIIIKLGMYIMAPETISTTQLKIIPPNSLCVCMYIPLSMLSYGSLKRLPLQQYTCNNRRIAARVISCAVRVVSKKLGYQFFPELLVLNNICKHRAFM
jgi:hypothetical protein